eukprot:gb/GECG01011065.1/.p1 GENE.gb/GECG01011065.1/~~gb/GECG01011065.1/.p1  ORF type:complete len:254 (+),score=22.17 gb/GECG01011065.1/:1-762(+)
MSEIVQGIYIGGDAEASNFTWLKEHDIRYILNVTPGKTESPSGGVPNYFESRGLFTYKRCPLYDNGTNDIRSVLTESIGFIKQGIHYGNVLVHCVQGVSRSVSVVVAYLMMVEGMSSKRARRYIRKKRPAAQPNKYFLDQLKEFEKTLDVGDRRVPSKKRAAGTSTGSSGRSKATRRSEKGTIGPTLPPSMRKMTGKEDHLEPSSDGDSGDDAIAIGPALPPHLRRSSASELQKPPTENGKKNGGCRDTSQAP